MFTLYPLTWVTPPWTSPQEGYVTSSLRECGDYSGPEEVEEDEEEVFGSIRMYSGVFGSLWKYSEVFGCIWK